MPGQVTCLVRSWPRLSQTFILNEVLALERVSLEVREREFLAVIGPSGCGKSTLLRMIAGLEHISGGEICISERVVNTLTPKEIADGWVLLWDGETTFGWHNPNDSKWTIAEGMLAPQVRANRSTCGKRVMGRIPGTSGASMPRAAQRSRKRKNTPMS